MLETAALFPGAILSGFLRPVWLCRNHATKLKLKIPSKANCCFPSKDKCSNNSNLVPCPKILRILMALNELKITEQVKISLGMWRNHLNFLYEKAAIMPVKNTQRATSPVVFTEEDMLLHGLGTRLSLQYKSLECLDIFFLQGQSNWLFDWLILFVISSQGLGWLQIQWDGTHRTALHLIFVKILSFC